MKFLKSFFINLDNLKINSSNVHILHESIFDSMLMFISNTSKMFLSSLSVFIPFVFFLSFPSLPFPFPFFPSL